MRPAYRKSYPNDYTYGYGGCERRWTKTGGYIGTPHTLPNRLSLEKGDFILRVWKAWYGLDFTCAGSPYLASWLDRPLGCEMHKIKMINPMVDRCAIEGPDTDSYVLFDIHIMNASVEPCFVIFDVHEYHLSEEDEMLIRLTI